MPLSSLRSADLACFRSELNLPRYKLVLQSVIGEVQGQGAFTASRCLWDTEVDNYASYSFKNASIFCVVMVFGIYVD